MSSPKNIDLYRDFAAGVNVSESQPERHISSPLHNIYDTCIQYTNLHKEVGGGGIVEPERRLEGLQFTKLGRKYQHD
jgi:hypothetical protein